MEPQRQRQREFDDLRERAEALLRESSPAVATDILKDLSELTYELQVSYAELELQNQELRETQTRLASSQDEFFNLYNHAPVGCVSVDSDGVIQRLNATARTWFGQNADIGVRRHVFQFVTPAHRGRFLSFLRKVFTEGGQHELNIEIQPIDDDPRWVALTGSLPQTGGSGEFEQVPTCMLTLADITSLKATQRELRQNEAQYRAIIEAVQDGLLIFDKGGNLGAVNPAACRMLGYSLEELLNTRIGRLLPSSSRHLMRDIRQGIRDAGKFEGRGCVQRRNGSLLHVELTCVMFLYQGRPHTLALVRDIEEQIATERELNRAAVVFERSNEGIMIADNEYRVTLLNDAAVEITGFSREQILGRDLFGLRSGHESGPDAGVQESLDAVGYWSGEMSLRRPSGEPYLVWITLTVTIDEDTRDRNYIVIFHDITEHRQAEERIRQLAHFDSLTGLPNRALFQDRLEQAITHARRADSFIALMFADLDNFKAINDSLGHLAGDELLCEVADRLKGCVRAEDTIARMGGDEFTVILGDVADGPTAQRVAARQARAILEALGQPVERGGHEMFTAGSIGVAIYPRDARSAGDLVRCADTAMYAAKRAGKGRYQFFSGSMNAQARRRLQLENGLRRAMRQGEFQIHYQPEVTSDTGAQVGVEALLRWTDPEGGASSPAEFIAVAEETGLIVQIGSWVLQEACRQARRWLDAGLGLGRMAVNVSSRQLGTGDFPSLVDQALADSGLPPEHLEIEVCERAFISNLEETCDVLEQVRQRGVTVAIDDFGTGYSSLGYLKRLPVDKLKIDQSFVDALETNADDQAIVRAVVTLGQTFGLTILAEGVERESQAAWLRECGCHQLQGFWFGVPLAPEDAAEMMS